jgi:HD superfamily phosphohydrolase
MKRKSGEFCANSPLICRENVAAIVRGDFRPMALAQLVSSQLDVDRMDYLLRDSLMTGAKYGIYDVEWIIKSLEIDEENDRLYVAARGIYAVEDYLQARYYMFRQVYFHRTLRAAEAILKSLLRRALELFQTGKPIWVASGTPFEKILRNEKLSLHEHLALDDSDVMFHIKQWQRSDDAILSDLSKRFLNRRLFKIFDLDMPEAERHEFLEESKNLVKSAGFDTNYYFIEDSAGDVPYYFYTKEQTNKKNLIYVEEGFSRPRIREISEVSAAVRGLQKVIKSTAFAFRRNSNRKSPVFITAHKFVQNRQDKQDRLFDLHPAYPVYFFFHGNYSKIKAI